MIVEEFCKRYQFVKRFRKRYFKNLKNSQGKAIETRMGMEQGGGRV